MAPWRNAVRSTFRENLIIAQFMHREAVLLVAADGGASLNIRSLECGLFIDAPVSQLYEPNARPVQRASKRYVTSATPNPTNHA